jgi:hypothetical protein
MKNTFNKAQLSKVAKLRISITTSEWLYERIINAIEDCENAIRDKDYEWGTFERDTNGDIVKDSNGKYKSVPGGEVNGWVLESSPFADAGDYADPYEFFGEYGWFEDEDEETLDKIDIERCWHDGHKFRSFIEFVNLIQHGDITNEYIDFEYDYIELYIDFQTFTTDIKRQMALEKILD